MIQNPSLMIQNLQTSSPTSQQPPPTHAASPVSPLVSPSLLHHQTQICYHLNTTTKTSRQGGDRRTWRHDCREEVELGDATAGAARKRQRDNNEEIERGGGTESSRRRENRGGHDGGGWLRRFNK
ncbi:hypothetical protein PIB30_010924 [Stylosanthes scabra]|uniref:Uncharacterized protein n=1 Tax=Stylosanthes scabra TaxID=79078 RepID=A0ABU6T5I5_9FABA|nr:hypothetical protein [Stylosanthes scabra]